MCSTFVNRFDQNESIFPVIIHQAKRIRDGNGTETWDFTPEQLGQHATWMESYPIDTTHRQYTLEQAGYVWLNNHEEKSSKAVESLMMKELRAKPPVPSKHSFLFITVSPPHTMDPILFYEKIVRYFKSRGTPCSIVFEQKGKDLLTMGEHFHCHIICDRKETIKIGNDKQNLQEYLSKNFGYTHITSHKEEHRKDKERYVVDEKDTQSKNECLEWDKLYRKELGIEDEIILD